MVVLPQEEYVQLNSTRNIQQPLAQQLQDLTKTDENIEKIQDPYRKLQLHANNIEERRIIRDKIRKFITLSTPRRYRSRAENLLNFIEPFVQFNERGEVLDRENHVIEGSHIDDLLQHAVRDMRRKSVKPTGWDYFRDVLAREYVPHNIIGAPTITELNKPLTTNNRKLKREANDGSIASPKIPRTSHYVKTYSK